MARATNRTGLGVLGAGAAACAACCAGPVLGFLAATGLASAVGAAAFGLAGVVVVLAGAAAVHRRRRGRRRSGAPSDPAAGGGPVPVAGPRRKVSAPNRDLDRRQVL